MKLDVAPLLGAIERYIAKADDDLEDTLKDEGYVAAGTAVEAINSIEDQVAEALNDHTDLLLDAVESASSVEELLTVVWEEAKDKSDLKEKLKEIFYKEFQNLVGQFTYHWLLSEEPDVATIYAKEPAISAPTYDFISTWSSQLADLMKLSTDTQIEKILRKASDEKLSIDSVADLIADSGIRETGYRARRVATTEVLRLQSYTQMESMTQDPLAYKKRWVHVPSSNPRENHIVMDGQEVFKRETFVLNGKDGVTYNPKCPRDICLPAAESINCHCIMETIKDDNALGMTDEELEAMREEALDEVNAQWAVDHASDKVNIIKSMDHQDQVRYFGGKKDGEARLALIRSGVIDTDEKLQKLYKTDENGKISLKSLQELAEDGIFTVSDSRLKHSVMGDFSRPSKEYPNGRMKAGGHGQTSMGKCDKLGIEYSVTKTYSNGVRAGNIPSSGMAAKRTGNAQLWFPDDWDEEKIRLAGTSVANNGMPFNNGYQKTGVYDGVAVRVLITQENVGTVCPDIDQAAYVKGVK